MRPPNRPVLLVFAMLPCLLIAAVAWFVIPQFQQIFRNFGANLPFATAAVLATYRWWALSALLPLALWSGWPPTRDPNAAAVMFGNLLAGAMGLLGVIALYLPIFRLADLAGGARGVRATLRRSASYRARWCSPRQ